MDTALCPQTHSCHSEKLVALVAGKNVLAQKVLFFTAFWKTCCWVLSFFPLQVSLYLERDIFTFLFTYVKYYELILVHVTYINVSYS